MRLILLGVAVAIPLAWVLVVKWPQISKWLTDKRTIQ